MKGEMQVTTLDIILAFINIGCLITNAYFAWWAKKKDVPTMGLHIMVAIGNLVGAIVCIF